MGGYRYQETRASATYSCGLCSPHGIRKGDIYWHRARPVPGMKWRNHDKLCLKCGDQHIAEKVSWVKKIVWQYRDGLPKPLNKVDNKILGPYIHLHGGNDRPEDATAAQYRWDNGGRLLIAETNYMALQFGDKIYKSEADILTELYMVVCTVLSGDEVVLYRNNDNMFVPVRSVLLIEADMNERREALARLESQVKDEVGRINIQIAALSAERAQANNKKHPDPKDFLQPEGCKCHTDVLPGACGLCEVAFNTTDKCDTCPCITCMNGKSECLKSVHCKYMKG